MQKPTVAIVDNATDVTGAIKAILSFAEYSKDEFSFIFILPSASLASNHIAAKGFKVVEIPFLELSRNWMKMFLYLPNLIINGIRLKKVIKQFQVDLVHVNDFYNMAPIVGKVLAGGFKLITHVRFMPDRFPAQLMKIWVSLSLRYGESIICVSDSVKRKLPPHPKIRVIYDTLFPFEPPVLINEEPNECVRLIYLGHYILGKGQDYGLEAFALAYKENPKLLLNFVGGDLGIEKNKQFKRDLVDRAKFLQLNEVVAFGGPTLRPKDKIMAADIALNFSESESFSMTCLEALSLGIPLIATDCGGPAELFIHKESGWLIPNRDIIAMKEAILHLSENVEVRRKLNRNSPIFVRRKFAVSNTLEKLQALYLNVLNKP